MLEDEFGEEIDGSQKLEHRDLNRFELILNMRAQIEEESRKLRNHEQSKIF